MLFRSIQKADQVANMIFSLSKYIRYVLSNQTQNVILSDEIDYAERYLQIQKMRMDDRLSYQINCDPAVMCILCPKFIIQPLIENAIKHGIANRPEGGVISLCIEKSDELIKIVVIDDGDGINVEKLNELNSLLECGESVEHLASGYGVGLSNVNRRMRYYFGMSFRMKLSPSPQRGLTVQMIWKNRGDTDEDTCS